MPHEEEDHPYGDSPFRLRRSRFTTLEERLEKLVHSGEASACEFFAWLVRKIEDDHGDAVLHKLERLTDPELRAEPVRSPEQIAAALEVVLRRAVEELRRDGFLPVDEEVKP